MRQRLMNPEIELTAEARAKRQNSSPPVSVIRKRILRQPVVKR